MVRGLAKNQSCAALPFLFFPRTDEASELRSPPAGLVDLIAEAAGRAELGAVVVLDADTERGASLAALLSETDASQSVVASSSEELAALGGELSQSVVVIRSPDAAEIDSVRSVEAQTHRRPTILVLCGLLDDRTDLSALEADPRAVLVNDGVFSSAELALFVRSLASGKAPLPPYTGAIVKKGPALSEPSLFVRDHPVEDRRRHQRERGLSDARLQEGTRHLSLGIPDPSPRARSAEAAARWVPKRPCRGRGGWFPGSGLFLPRIPQTGGPSPQGVQGGFCLTVSRKYADSDISIIFIDSDRS